MSYEYKCPNCEKTLFKIESNIYTLGNPIRTCPHCNKEYWHRFTYEWSILSPLHKFFYCFLANGRICFMLIVIMYLVNHNLKASGIWLLIWVSVSLLRLKIRDSNKIQESYQRTKDSPEHIKKLSDLGCTSIDIRIDPYYK